MCISGLNTLAMRLHVWVRRCVRVHWLRHAVHAKCSHSGKRHVAVDMFTLWHLCLVHQAWEGRGAWEASAGEGGVKCTQAEDIHDYIDAYTQTPVSTCTAMTATVPVNMWSLYQDSVGTLLCSGRHEVIMDVQTMSFMTTSCLSASCISRWRSVGRSS